MRRRRFFGSLVAALAPLAFWRTAALAPLAFWRTAGLEEFRILRTQGDASSLERYALQAFKILHHHVKRPLGIRWNHEDEVAQNGDTIGSPMALLSEKYVSFGEEASEVMDSKFFESVIVPLAKGINDSLKDASVIFVRSLPCLPNGLGAETVIVSRDGLSLRAMRSYQHKLRGLEISFGVLYGTV